MKLELGSSLHNTSLMSYLLFYFFQNCVKKPDACMFLSVRNRLYFNHAFDFNKTSTCNKLSSKSFDVHTSVLSDLAVTMTSWRPYCRKKNFHGFIYIFFNLTIRSITSDFLSYQLIFQIAGFIWMPKSVKIKVKKNLIIVT